jgi:transposase
MKRFVDELDLAKLGFEGAEPAVTGRPAYHPGTLLKIYSYGYLNACPRADAWGASRSATSS